MSFPPSRYIVEWRVHVVTRMDGRRELTLCSMARTARGAKAAALDAAGAAIDGEVRISIACEAAGGRRAPVYAGRLELKAWQATEGSLPSQTRASAWAATVAGAAARAAFATVLRQAVRGAVAARLLERAAGALLVEAAEQALEGRGPLLDPAFRADRATPGGSARS